MNEEVEACLSLEILVGNFKRLVAMFLLSRGLMDFNFKKIALSVLSHIQNAPIRNTDWIQFSVGMLVMA